MDKTKYNVTIKKNILKKLNKLPENIQDKLFILAEDLKDKGPLAKDWPNFSPLGEEKYHCHLGYSWVACWKYYKDIITIEVYYAGSRENAPY
ncbi:MAG: putative cytosolic protein [uncultured bacterium]|nr:MAG: putative cytosolic protein [uncultured bacterium]